MRKRIALIVLCLFVGGMALYGYLILYIQSQAFADTARPSDAIVVLGTGPNLRGPNPCLVARVKHAADLQHQGFATKVIFSGGKVGAAIQSEAAVMKEVARDFAIDPDSILLEPASQSTYENLLFSLAIMRREGLHSMIIISDAYHLPRAALIAEKLGLDYTVSPASDSPCTTERHNQQLFLTNEPLKMVIYKLTGKL